ncbi:MAG TPA: Clp protease N-terminal domain-containing protein, partial [Aggregatilineales bacterium]|nr:Clp protease N-terminal domain-containing protein [Aggregatilineales bacterium]
MGLSDRRYSQHARRSLIRARRLAREFYHPAVETDHVVLGMLRTESSIGYRVLSEFRIDQIRAEGIVRGLYSYQYNQRTDLPPFSRNLQSVLLYASDEAYWLGSHYIGTEHILLGLVRSGTGQLSNLLLQLQISSHQVRHSIRHVLSEGAYETNLEAVRRSARLSELSRRVLNGAA